jgi:hypothetical protein
MLYNFKDSPDDLYQRMRLNIDLNDSLNIRIFSFPMRYQPTDMKERTHIGQKWNRYYLRSMQVVLQATHGIVSGSPDFFKRAFGDSVEEFETLLLRPERYLFNRRWYEELDGQAEFEDFQVHFRRLSETDRQELIALLSDSSQSTHGAQVSSASSQTVRDILPYYQAISKYDEAQIWKSMKQRQFERVTSGVPEIPEDELVEDAGLSEVI